MFRIQIGTQGLAVPKVVTVEFADRQPEVPPVPVAPPLGARDKKMPSKRRLR